MCDVVSGWMNRKTLEIVIADPRSHSRTQELMGWTSLQIGDWGEWEWTREGQLVSRGCTDAMQKMILEKWQTRAALLPYAREQAAKHKISLIFSHDHIAELEYQKGFEIVLDLAGDVTLPDNAKTVDASGCTALTSLDAKAASVVR